MGYIFLAILLVMFLFMKLSFTLALIICLVLTLLALAFLIPSDVFYFGGFMLYPIVIVVAVAIWIAHYMILHLHFS